MDIGLIFNILLNQPITNLLVICYQLLHFLHIPFALGFSIILLTCIIRAILFPLTSSQIKMSKKMQDMAPHISKLKEKHKSDKKKQQEEMIRLTRWICGLTVVMVIVGIIQVVQIVVSFNKPH
jgi:YidC/Oxa1 family membrane protein insertase